MKRNISLLVIGSMAATMMNFGIASAANSTTALGFSDVKSSDASYKAIEWLTLNGVIKGYGDGTFRPNNPVNRAEMLKMIFLADGNEDDADAAMSPSLMFPDTPKSEWYAKYVALARKRGTVQGYPDGTFRPGSNINKAEAYKIVLKEFYNETTMSYTVTHGDLPNTGVIPPDVKKTDWYSMFVNFAALKNIYDAGEWTHTVNGSYFYPGQNLTRGELATLIYRAKAVSDNFPNNIEEAGSMYGTNIIPFNTSLYSLNFAESSGKPTFVIDPQNHPNSTLGYATKYPQSLLKSSGDTADTLNYFNGVDNKVLEISFVTKENKDLLSIQKYLELDPSTNPYAMSSSHEDLLVNGMPAVWFHKVGKDVSKVDEVVVVQFANAIAIITDHGSHHVEDGVFNYMVRNFWFKNFAV